jgi:PEP-CTERM motif
MQGKGRRILLNVMSIMVILAMVMLGPTGSQAQTTTPTTRPVKSVPEPGTSVLLLLSIGLTGLVGYRLKRRKYAAIPAHSLGAL